MHGICSARDIPNPKEDADRPFISFSATEATSSAATTTLEQEKGTWSFGPSSATCPWSFAEREKPVVDFRRQSKYNPTFMFNTDGEGVPLYGTALMSLPVPVAYNKAIDCSNLVHVLVDSGASDHYFDDFLFPELNRCLLDYTCLTTPSKILTAARALLVGTREGILQGIIPDHYGNGHLVQTQILVVPTIGHNLFSVKRATRNGIVFICDPENPRLEAFDITLPPREEQNDSYFFVLHLSADVYGATELAMYVASNAQLWHRRLGHLNRRTLELMQRHDGKGITFDGTTADCDVSAVGKGQQLAHPKKAQHAGITRHFQLCYGDLMAPFTPQSLREFQIHQQDHRPVHQMDAVYLLNNKRCAFDSFRLFVTSTVIPCGDRVIRWRADKRGEYTSKAMRVRARWPGPLQYGSLRSRRRWTPALVVRGAHAYC